MSTEEILQAAVEKATPAERSAYLDVACGQDANLRARIDGLLNAHDAAGSFLERSLFETPMVGQNPSVEKPGRVIGPYKLLQQIGEGGMGVVFMAQQTQPVQRKVALKIIKPGMDSRQVIARFEAERQALAMMDHASIARVFDGGTTAGEPGGVCPGRPYFVMELVHGVPITKYCDDNHLTLRERLELFVPVCQAIQHAHQKGIIHRDIKPSNVMVTLYDGKPVPKVIDFGVAKAMEQKLAEQTLFTQYGTIVGTLEYMSPEQAEMSALGVDTRSDIYSLGVLMYELLTGSTPLIRNRVKEAAYAEILRMIKEEEPPRPSTRLSDSGEALASISAQRKTEPAKLSRLMRGELDWIVMKTLEKDRNRRYATANGLAADVQRYLADELVQACPPSAAYRLRKFSQRNKRALATVGLLAVVLITGTVISAWQAIRATEALRLTEMAQITAKHRLFEAKLAQARAGQLSQRVGRRFDSLVSLAEASKIANEVNLPGESFLELRNAAIGCLALLDLRLDRQLGDNGHVDFDDKLERYARADMHGAVSIRRVADDVEIVPPLPATGSETFVQFSRDGKFLRAQSFSSVKVWKLNGARANLVVEEAVGGFFGGDLSADGRQCATGHADGSISLYDLESPQQPRRLAGRRGTQMAFHPEGRQIAVSCNNSVEIRNLDTGAVVHDLKHPDMAEHVAWHPDGRTLAAVCADSGVYVWDVAARKYTTVLDGIRSGGVATTFNHAGDLLASIGWEGKLRLWDPRSGKQLFSMIGWFPFLPRFSPDDRLLAACAPGGGKLALWEVATSSGYRTLARPRAAGIGANHYTAIRSDGRLLAVGMQTGVGLWDLTSGKELAFLKLPGCDSVVFEPSSGALLTNGTDGLRRWPVRGEPAMPWLLRIGPPQKLPVPGPICLIACSQDSQVIAVSQYEGGRVLHADCPERLVPLGPHHDARYVAVSPNGHWVATGSFSNWGAKIWEARSGKPVKEWSADSGDVRFSPDGKWLAVAASGVQLWVVDSWQKGPKIGGAAPAFSPDGKLLAVDTTYGAVRLVNPDTGREYARLEDPNQDRSSHISFSPDGAQLVASNDDSRSIHVWDLRAIRKQLDEMGLDWDLPPYPAPMLDRNPLSVEVDPEANNGARDLGDQGSRHAPW